MLSSEQTNWQITRAAFEVPDYIPDAQVKRYVKAKVPRDKFNSERVDMCRNLDGKEEKNNISSKS